MSSVLTAVAMIGSLLAMLTASPADASARPTCRGNVATIVGTAGDDNIRGTEGNDVIFAGHGNDRIVGLGGHDVICGGPGNDVITGSEGHDVLVGEAGEDLLVGGDGVDELIGSNGNDRLVGGDGPDLLIGNAGDDLLQGGGLNDQLWGGPGNDTLIGGGGYDRLWGGDGWDKVNGGGQYSFCEGEVKTDCNTRSLTSSDVRRGATILLATDRESWSQLLAAKRTLDRVVVHGNTGYGADGTSVELKPGTRTQITPGGNVSINDADVRQPYYHEDGSTTYLMDDGTTVHQPADPTQPATVTTPPAEPKEEPQKLDPMLPSQCQSCHGSTTGGSQEEHADGEGIDNSDGGAAGESGCGECGGEGMGDGGQNVGDSEAMGDD